MKRNVIALTLVLGASLGVLFLTPVFNNASAGVEPSPFQPEINQLFAVSNILHSADYRVAKTIAHPPDPCVPPDPCNSPDLNGAVNRLEAIENQVSSADDMVKALIEEVMGFEPTPFRNDVIPALEVVRDAALSIDVRIEPYLSMPLDPYIEALGSVAHKASDVVETAEWGIEQISSGGPVCAEIEHEDECVAVLYCEWVPASTTPGYCRSVEY